ncbi:hypothetical protein HS1genome_1711 [Sulfodiicoccus acidiphilus]|uniref:N-acetyltransferase domain-containing protein n=1 Tax=Sulfodiicoccus acidiphilus TaxID=1670455 RepID=A0A348B570_9CREN|nr:GNAT family N-acetyltransferase [Sulfodiicoccus acidiphilus]BBD73322.1 hypothetical protein HS1genome_1711 [Sulfodiicoccus acidiphilus]GGT89116.1 hypothetical protein GCM10007116_03680 [Sulfodiicoccus acidiphilus]
MYFQRMDALPEDVRELVRSLYRRDPLTYVYLFNDLVDEEEGVASGLTLQGSSILQEYRGMRRRDLLLYGDGVELVSGYFDTLQTFNTSRLDELEHKVGLGRVPFLDMTCRSPRVVGDARRLTPADAPAYFSFIRSVWRRGDNVERTSRYLERRVVYGSFEGKELVSVAEAYVTLPEVWVVGGVFTLPSFRGRGHAKAVTSAVAAHASRNGATTLLHVREDNEPAVRAYEDVGFEVLRRRWWFLRQ